jgi:fructose-1,6-bisphosphatase/inositol monophosphatase family enzyme
MYERELEVASRLVQELGANMRDNIGLIEEADIEQKEEDRSLITHIDRLNNQLGIQILKQEFPRRRRSRRRRQRA